MGEDLEENTESLRTIEVYRIKALRKAFKKDVIRRMKKITIQHIQGGWLPKFDTIIKNVLQVMADFIKKHPNETSEVLVLICQDAEPSTLQPELLKQLDKVEPLRG